MSTARERILERLAAGEITREQAEGELDSLAAKGRPAEWLFFPMRRLTLGHALGIAALVALAQLAVSRLQIRFDGALDMHVVGEAVSWGTALLDLAVAWPLTAIVLFAVARPIANTGRFVDFLAMVGGARIPQVIAGATAGYFRPMLLGTAEALEAGGEASVVGLVLTGAILPLTIWFVALLVTGIRTVTGLRGGKLAFASILGILLAEVLSLVILALL